MSYAQIVLKIIITLKTRHGKEQEGAVSSLRSRKIKFGRKVAILLFCFQRTAREGFGLLNTYKRVPQGKLTVSFYFI